MNELHRKILTSIQIFTNANTEEIHHETMFNAVLDSLDNRITESDFLEFFKWKVSATWLEFNRNFVAKLYSEYDCLYSYIIMNRDKIITKK